MNNLLKYFVLFVFITLSVAAQDIPPVTSGIIRVQSEPEGAEVFFGDSLIGATPLRIQRSQANAITVWYPARNTWNTRMQPIPKNALSELEGIVVLKFDVPVLIQSIPSNAAIYYQDSIIARTPARIVLPHGTDRLTISKPGYEPYILPIPLPPERPSTAILTPDAHRTPEPEVMQHTTTITIPNTELLVASAVGLGAGIAAVALKSEADSRYDTYKQTGLEADRSASRRYDFYSGIALALMQISLAYLVYELFLPS